MKTKIITILSLGAAMIYSILTLTSCLSDGDDTVTLQGEENKGQLLSEEDYTQKLFSVSGGEFIDSSMPSAENNDNLSVTTNTSSLAGGMNFIRIDTPTMYDRILIGVKGYSGYWEYIPEENPPYLITLYFGPEYGEDIELVIVGVRDNGQSDGCISNIKFVESKSGDLNINLTFSTPKDVDLHLIMPSGKEIYYGNRGGTVTIDGTAISYGLDHDSNAGCSIDNLNNENIYIPAQLVENGEYTVIVNLYKNCNNSYSTDWTVAVRYKGQFISNELAAHDNPVRGSYSQDASSGDRTVVMKFHINDADSGTRSRFSSYPYGSDFIPFPLSQSEKMKVDYNLD